MKKEVYVSVSTDPIKEYQAVYEYAKEMQGVADFLHCDIMDGLFVPKKTYDYQLVGNINQNSGIMLDVHLMCREPLASLDGYINAGANIITVHYEAFENKNDLMLALKKLKENHILAGLSINPDTNLKEIKVYLHDFDIILIMGVVPGESGQKFMRETLDKIKTLNEIRNDNDFKYKIEVDGGVNLENATEIVEAGADILVSGSYVYYSSDHIKAVQDLKNA